MRSSLTEARSVLLCTRGFLALRLPRPLMQEETGVRWFTDPPDTARDDLQWYTDGSMKFGPLWEFRRTGCALVAVSGSGDLVAYGNAVPPPWVRTAAAAELWAVLLVLSWATVTPRICTDCRSILTAAASGTAQATAPTGMLARIWSRVAAVVAGDVAELVTSGKLIWMPAHTTPAMVGTARRSDGQFLTALDWRANRLADVVAKAAAGCPPECVAAQSLFNSAERLVAHEGAVLGAVTHAANHHVQLVCDRTGAQRRVTMRDAAAARPALRRVRARAASPPAPPPPRELAPRTAVVGALAPGVGLADGLVRTMGARCKARAAAARAATVARVAGAAAATRAICLARGAAVRPSSAPPAAERLDALRARVLARQGVAAAP